jgi:drug/metabolite transporter (DMT)-like permease
LGPSRAGSYAVALAAALWGTWGLVLRRAGLPPGQSACIALFTMAVAGTPLLPRRLPRGRDTWLALGAVGVCDAGNILLFFWAVQRGPIGVAVLAHYLAPVLVALASPLILRSWPRGVTLAALPVSLGGLALLLGRDLLELGSALTTALLGAGSAIFYAGCVLFSKRLADRLAPAEILVYHVALSALLLVPWAWFAPVPAAGAVAAVAAGALVTGVGAGLLFLWGLARIPAARASILSYLEPLVAVLLGTLVLHEHLAPLAPLGGLLIVAAGFVVVRVEGGP